MKNRIDLANYFNQLGFTRGVEVGVADGRYSETLCKAIPGLQLACIDPWDTYHGNHRGGRKDHQKQNYDIATTRLKPYQCDLIRMTSMQALYYISNNSIDFVFIDGNHDYEYVLADIVGWNEKVKVGGIISGHDYYSFRNSGVIEAVDEYCSSHNIIPNIIGDSKRKAINDNYQACFWWRKV